MAEGSDATDMINLDVDGMVMVMVMVVYIDDTVNAICDAFKMVDMSVDRDLIKVRLTKFESKRIQYAFNTI